MMATLALWAILVALLLPLAPALAEWRRPRDTAAMPIRREHDGDCRALARNERTRLEAALGVPLARQVKVHAADGPRLVAGNWVCAHPRYLPPHSIYLENLYCAAPMRTGEHCRLGGVIVDGLLTLGRGSEVHCFAHGRAVHARPGCSLPGRITALRRIRLQPPCGFVRVAAARIEFGVPPRPASATPKYAAPARRHQPPGLAEKGQTGGHVGDVLAHAALVIADGACIVGAIKGRGDVHIGAHADVAGAVISGAVLVVGRGARIAGPVVAHQRIVFEGDCTVGTLLSPAAVCAPHVEIRGATLIHGSVWARAGGIFVIPEGV